MKIKLDTLYNKNKKTKLNDNVSCVIVIYDGIITDLSDSYYRKAIFCHTRKDAYKYLLEKGYVREDYIEMTESNSKYKAKENLLYYNAKKKKIAGIKECEVLKK